MSYLLDYEYHSYFEQHGIKCRKWYKVLPDYDKDVIALQKLQKGIDFPDIVIEITTDVSDAYGVLSDAVLAIRKPLGGKVIFRAYKD